MTIRLGPLDAVGRTLDEASQRQVAAEAVDRTVRRLALGVGARPPTPMGAALREALFHERSRLATDHGPRSETDRAFFAGIARRVGRGSACDEDALLREVLTHYADEIRGRFDPRIYEVATRALPFGLSALLNGLSPGRLRERSRDLPNLAENVVIEGEVETLRALAARGTVVLAPTHGSNLDSLVLGFAIYRMGLAPFAYGAGLNLFSNPITGYFMRRLGAYTVDRKKTDPLYRELLKEFAIGLLVRGQHNLFFPGGTRSRSGALETHLKKGLLGTTLTAFERNLRAGRPRPRLFVVPATTTYPLILEAESLIADHLERAGRGRYLAMPEELGVRRWLQFLRGLLQLDLRVRVVIGRPLDPIGNDVDADGQSYDPRGRPVDPTRYLLVEGELRADAARDAEYTTAVEERLLASYRSDNVAMPSSVLAFAVLELLRRRTPGIDVFRLLERSAIDDDVPESEVRREVGELLVEIDRAAAAGKIRRSSEAADPAAVIERGLQTFRTYHRTPIVERREDALHVGDPRLLFFYRNRLEGYGLRGAAPLLAEAPP